MNKINIWPLAAEAAHALEAHYLPAMDKAAKQAGLEPGEYGVLMAALSFDPQSISSWRLRVRFPYTAAGRYDQRLHKAARLGFLKSPAEGEYRLTELGKRTTRQIIDAAYKTMSRLKPMPQAELDRLALLLHRVVDASLAAPTPPDKWSITRSRRLDPGEDAHVMVKLDQYLSDLNAYRYDAHLAAWRPSELSGAAWETLTYLWRGEVKTLDDLAQKLERRGHTREDGAQALNDLVQRDLIAANGDTYRVTKQGQALRQSAEDQTDQYFYAPWAGLRAGLMAGLKNGEVQDMRRLLGQLRDGLKK